MKQQITKPEIGTTMYYVCEHFYYRKDNSPVPAKEYCVCSGVVTGYFLGGYPEFRVVGKNPDGFPVPRHYRLKDIGRKVFYSAAEAVALAEEMTKKYEQRWGWLGEPDIPLRRPWEVQKII